MNKKKRKPTTIYLDPKIAQAMKVKAALTGGSMSDLVNDALTDRLKRDEKALKIFRERRHEPTRSYEDFIREMKRDGLI